MELDSSQLGQGRAEQAADELLTQEIVRREQRRSRRRNFIGGAFAIRELSRYPKPIRRRIIEAARPAMLRDWNLWFWVALIVAVAGLSFWGAQAGLVRTPFPLPMVYAILWLCALGGRAVWRRHVVAYLRAHPA